jgi:hypothetical protein
LEVFVLKKFVGLVLVFLMLVSLVSPSVFATKDFKAYNEHLDPGTSLVLSLINDYPIEYDLFIKKAKEKGKNPFVLDKEKKNQGSFEIFLDDIQEVDQQYSKISGKIKVKLNSINHTFKYENQNMNVYVLDDGTKLYMIDIDTEFKNGKESTISSVHFTWIPETDQKYASISVGTLSNNGVAILEFGERYETQELWSQIRTIENSKQKENTVKIHSNETWANVKYKNTISGQYDINNNYWGRNLVATIGSMYSTNCGCGEVEIRVFGTGEDIKNATGTNLAVPDKVKAGVTHKNGQLTRVYPSATTSSVDQASILFDFLSYAGVPNNTIKVWANGIAGQITHASTGANNMSGEVYRSSGLSNINIPASVKKEDADRTYNNTKKGFAFRFLVNNYDYYAQVRSYAQVRYIGTTAFGSTTRIWSSEQWYNHYMW